VQAFSLLYGRPKDPSRKRSNHCLEALLDDRWVKDVERDLNQANARALIANQIATNNAEKRRAPGPIPGPGVAY